MSIGIDGTGMQTNNAGFYRITKYGDPDAKRRKHLVVEYLKENSAKVFQWEVELSKMEEKDLQEGKH